jgi:tRNA(Ile)-lysidine synthase
VNRAALPADHDMTAFDARPVEIASRFLARLKTPACILVAVSGGSDSLGLLVALVKAAQDLPKGTITIHAATVDHALRSGSAEEAQWVADFCKARAIPHHMRRWEGEKPKTGLSSAARDARYDLLADLSRRIGADCLVIGHTEDDQNETVTMREGRSSRQAVGLAGMASAMLLRRDVWVFRPFLAVRRQAIRDFLVRQGISWIDDPSNVNRAYERVRVRQMLGGDLSALPVSTVRHGVERAALSHEAAAFMRKNVRISGWCVAEIVLDGDIAGEPGLFAVTTLMAVLGGSAYRMGPDQTDKLRDFLGRGVRQRLSLARVVLDLRGDRLYISREARHLPVLDVAAGTSTVWDGRFMVTASGGQPVRISQTGAVDPALSSFLEALPGAVRQRAIKALPHYSRLCEDHHLADNAPKFQLFFAVFDRFLPEFEFSLANAVAEIFKQPQYRPAPLDNSAGKQGSV